MVRRLSLDPPGLAPLVSASAAATAQALSRGRAVSTPRGRLAVTGLHVAALSLGAMVVLTQIWTHETPPVPSPAPPADIRPARPMPTRALTRPYPLFAVEAAAIEGMPARIYTTEFPGKSRTRDTLIFGVPGQAAAYLRLDVDWGPAPALSGACPSLFVDMVRRASEGGIAVLRLSRPETLEGRFGALETAAISLSGQAQRDCLAFRRVRTDDGLGLAGWLCPASDRAMSPGELACVMEGLTLAGPTPDQALRLVFAQAERRLSRCRQTEASSQPRRVSLR